MSNIFSCWEQAKIGKETDFEASLRTLRGPDTDISVEEAEIKVQSLEFFSIGILWFLSPCNLTVY